MVGAARLELATPRSQSECATKLRYAPTTLFLYNQNDSKEIYRIVYRFLAVLQVVFSNSPQNTHPLD